MVDLHAYVTRGVLALESVVLDALDTGDETLPAGQSRKVYLAVGQTRQHVEAALQLLLATGQHEIVLGSQRSRIECRDENRLGFLLRIGDKTERTLHQTGPDTRREHRLDDLLARGRTKVCRLELLVLLYGVGIDHDIEQLALLAAIDGRNGAADGRSEQHARIVLIEEQRVAGLDPVADLHQQLRSNVLVIERAYGIRRSQRPFGHGALGASHKINVETFT